LNNISPTQVVAAASDVWRGRAVSLAAPIESEVALDNPDPAVLQMTHTGTGSALASGLSFAMDRVTMNIHGNTDSHDDHMAHRFAYLKTDIPVAGCAHQAGTVRFGADPATSVLDRDCRAHELDNLYVADTSIFPSISAVNPALTAMANAIRVGDHILERLG
jgi:choline dehydrogenase-like flavoprotein